jgi:hypothetical protein
MMYFFEHLPWVISAPLIVATFTFFACCGVYMTRALINPAALKAHHDVAAVVFANLGVLYSVLLAFTVVNVQQRFDKIKETTQVEASYLNDLYRDAEVFQQEDKNKIRELLLAYSQNVIQIEWPQMSNGDILDHTNEYLSKLWNVYYALDATTHKQEQWYAVSISKLNQLVNARLSRILGSRESLGSEMWAMLISGAIALAGFICFFGLESITSHLLMTAVLASTTGFLLFLIYSLDTVFSGNVSIPPEAMEAFFKTFSQP